MTTNTVNPAKMENMMSMLFGRKAALTILANNPSFREYSLKRLKDLYGPKEPIGTKNFNVKDLSTDVKTIADGFGFDKSNLQFVGIDDNETFQKLLDVLDMVFSTALVVPMDQIDEVKSGIKMVAQALNKYVPNFKTIGKLLSMAPGIAKYSKALITFGESMDHAVDIINRGGDNCVRQAIKELRNGIDSLRDVDIIDINKQVADAKISKNDIIEVEATSVTDVDNSKKEKSKKEEKKEEKKKEESKPIGKKVITGTDESSSAAAVAMSQQMIPGFIPDNDGSIPEFMQDLSIDKPKGSIPEFMAQTVQVPRVDAAQRIFAPVHQNPANTMDNRLAGYPFVNDIQAIANGVGIYTVPELIVDSGDNPMLIFIRAYNNQAYLSDKSFIIDLGKVIDNRYGIWPCAAPNGMYNVLESCDEVYRLFESDKSNSKINKDFLTTVFQYGFSNLADDVKKKHTLYGIRMTETNRSIALITMPDAFAMNREARNIIRGACIRLAPEIVANGYTKDGRFKFKWVNTENMEFCLTNEGMSHYFMTQAYPHRTCEILMKPVLDENGNFVPAGNKKGGTDIKYNATANYQ